MNRQQRRKMERERVKKTILSPLSPTPSPTPSPYEIFPPEPVPTGQTIGEYKYGGRNWVLITIAQPNHRYNILLAPHDAIQFAKDLEKVARGVNDDTDSIPIPTSTGLVIASTLPDKKG